MEERKQKKFLCKTYIFHSKKIHFPVFPSLSLASPFTVFLFFSDHTFPSSAFLFKPHFFLKGQLIGHTTSREALVSVLKMTLIL